MLRFTYMVFGLSFALSAAAAPAVTYRQINEEVVIHDVSVEPINGGINPAYTAYTVKGQVQLGGNACQATGLKAVFKTKQIGSGQQHLVAYVKGSQRTNLICPLNYQPVMVEVSSTVRGDFHLGENVFVRNVDEFGTLRTLSSFLTSELACDERAMCTREFRPTTCLLNGVEIKGSNRCEAKVAVKRFACMNRLQYVEEEISCRFDGQTIETK